jgi:uncharacterized protein (DUF1697 family)
MPSPPLVVISMLRGVNLARHHRIRMDALRALYESLGFDGVQTYIQSGNVIFRTGTRDLTRLARRIETAFEQAFGFHSDVILRTTAEMREVIAGNPFASQPGLEPAKLVVTFLATEPPDGAQQKIEAIPTSPEELRLRGRELYIYFPNGMGRSKLPLTQIGKALGSPGTARNWNTVLKLLALAEKLESTR